MKAFIVLMLSVLFGTNLQVQLQAQVETQTESMRNVENQQLVMQVMSLSNNQSLQRELAITDEQLELLRPVGQRYLKFAGELSTKYKNELAEAQELFQNNDAEGGKKLLGKFQTEMFEFVDELSAKVEDILLPHQISRLKQISKRQTSKLINKHGDEFGVPLALANQIGLSQQETKDLEETIAKVREEFYEEVAKLREKAQAKILKSLPSEKRDKLIELVGEDFNQKR